MAGVGSQPGERRGGRKAGVPNKVTVELKDLARKYTSEALERLHQIAITSQSDAASVAAIKEIFDRGYGKASQAITHSGTIETSMKDQRDAAVREAVSRGAK